MIDAFILDMDGTLVDFITLVRKSWNITFKQENWNKVVSDQEIRNIMGHTTEEISKMIFKDIPLQEACHRIEKACDEENNYILRNGTHKDLFIPDEQFLRDLSAKYQLFIVSNCRKGYIEAFFQISSFKSYFIDFANSENGLSKAENIAEIVKKYHLKNPFYVGDTKMDYRASKQANVSFIHAAYGYGKVCCQNKINHLNELLYWEKEHEEK